MCRRWIILVLNSNCNEKGADEFTLSALFEHTFHLSPYKKRYNTNMASILAHREEIIDKMM